MNKICICGDTQAGKTTFLKAIRSKGGYPQFLSDPNWPENKIFYDNKGVVATSGYSHLKGTLVDAKGQEYPVEFLDYPGEDFREGFIRNGKKDEKLSSFMKDCSFLYFFVEPKKVDEAHIGALADTLHCFKKQQKRQGSPIHACLVLTKADTLSTGDLRDWSSESVEKYVEKRAPGILNTLPDRADNFRCCAISAKGEKISAKDRKEFFAPYFQKENTRQRNHTVARTMIAVAIIGMLIFGGYKFYRWDQKETAGNPNHTPIIATPKNKIADLEKHRRTLNEFEQANYPKVNNDNLDEILAQLEKLKNPDGRKESIALRFKNKVRSQILNELEIRRDVYNNDPTTQHYEAYSEIAEKYCRRTGEKIPPEYQIDNRKMDLNGIENILNISFRGNLKEFAISRIENINSFLTNTRSISTEEKIAIAEAMQTAKMLADTGHYTVNVSFKGLSKPHVVAVTLTTSRYTEAESDGIHFDDIERDLQYNIPISIQWNLNRSIYLSLWKEAFWVGESPDEIAGFHQSYNTFNSIAIYPLCTNQWENAGWTNDETAAGVKFKCSVIGPDGQDLTQQRLNNVYWYILGDQYWTKLINQIRNDNN